MVLGSSSLCPSPSATPNHAGPDPALVAGFAHLERGKARIGAIERQPVRRGLHVLPAERHLGLTEAQAQTAFGVEEPVDIDVAQLTTILAPLGARLVVHRQQAQTGQCHGSI